MAIDASIYSQLQAPKFESPLNALAQVTQVRNAQNQNRLFDMKVAESERTLASENALNSAYSGAIGVDGTIDRNKLYQSIAQGGQGAKLPGIQKNFTDMDKSGFDSKKAQIETSLKTLDIVSQSLAPTLQNPALYPQVRAALMQQYPEGAANLPEQFDPNLVKSTIDKALTTKDRAEQDWKKIDLAYRQSNDAANRGVTIRGQNMTDSRGRDLAAATREAGGAKAPSGYRFKQDGSGGLEPIPGGPGEKDKAPTEFQGKSATFGARAEQSDKIISSLEGKYSPAALNAKLAMGAVGLETPANWLLSAEGQKAEQAQRDFVNAVLRQESGAAIADSEFNNAKKQYFPQPNDKPEVIAQKAQNRKTAIEGFKKNAGKAAYTATTTKPDSNIESLLDKYK